MIVLLAVRFEVGGDDWVVDGWDGVGVGEEDDPPVAGAFDVWLMIRVISLLQMGPVTDAPVEDNL